MTPIDDYVPLLLRIMLVALFPFSALDKVVNWRKAAEQADAGALTPVLLIAGILIETITPVCIVTGWFDRVAAFVLAGFCAVTAVLYHQFWTYRDFWRFRPGEGLEHFWEFLKNFGLVGGLGIVMLAPRTLPLSEAVQRPLASTVVVGAATGGPR